MLSTAEIAISSAVVVSLGAAISDARSGTIPNSLTLPPLLLAPVLYGAFLGHEQAGKSVAAALLSGFVPYLLFRRDAMGGGDVKLFAALGAVVGFAPMTGLRIQWVAFAAALLQSISVLVLRRRFFPTLRRIVSMVRRADPASEGAALPFTPVRLGGAVLAATIVQAIPYLAIVRAEP